MNDNNGLAILFSLGALWLLVNIFGDNMISNLSNGLQTLWGNNKTNVEIVLFEHFDESIINETVFAINETTVNENRETYNIETLTEPQLYGASCWTLEEQLIFEASIIPVKLADREGKQTEHLRNACSITSGEWLDPYSGQSVTDPNNMTTTFTVPLSSAALYEQWNDIEIQRYINSRDKWHHMVVSEESKLKIENSSILKWDPENENFVCQYYLYWSFIKLEWDLVFGVEEIELLQKELTDCFL